MPLPQLAGPNRLTRRTPLPYQPRACRQRPQNQKRPNRRYRCPSSKLPAANNVKPSKPTAKATSQPKPPPSKDTDARWIKKDGKYRLGYKQHTRTDAEGYIEKVYATPANAHETHHFQHLRKGVKVYADKGYDSKANRAALTAKRLSDGLMRKAHRGCPLTEEQTARNKRLSKIRYVVEQSFGILHRRFRYTKAAYFGIRKVTAQCRLKAICLNLLKAGNRLRVPACA